MRYVLALIIVIGLSFGPVVAGLAQNCDAVPGRQVRLISGEVAEGALFEWPLGKSWTFKLLPSRYGWDLRIADSAGTDLSQITPPFRTVPNAREIYGWHFRNAANSGENLGDVNAPQHLRLFFFDPGLSGTGGFKPSTSGTGLTSEPDATVGRGALTILDMKLADLEPGAKARMVALKFIVCLGWPDSAENVSVPDDDAIFTEENFEIMFSCGLDGAAYELAAWIAPVLLGGDLDDDGVLDHVAPVRRKSDGRAGLAICRAGTWLSLVGFEAGADTPLETADGEPRGETYSSFSQFLGQAEYWQIGVTEQGRQEVIVGRSEKAELAIFWDGESFDYRLVWVVISS